MCNIKFHLYNSIQFPLDPPTKSTVSFTLFYFSISTTFARVILHSCSTLLQTKPLVPFFHFSISTTLHVRTIPHSVPSSKFSCEIKQASKIEQKPA